MAYTIPQPIVDSFWTAHSTANGTRTAAGTPQEIAQWAVSQQMMTPEQASQIVTQPATQPATTGAPSSGMDLNALVSQTGPAGAGGVTLGSTIPNTPVAPPAQPALPAGPVTVAGQPQAGGTGLPPMNFTSTGTAGAGAYNQLMDLYKQTVPGADLTTPQGQAAFNQWTGTVMEKFPGVTRWEDLPSNFAQTVFPGVTTTATTPNINAPEGANYDVREAGSQAGAYASSGATSQTQQGQQTQNLTERQTQQGTSTQTGTTTGTTTATQQGTDTSQGATTGSTQVTTPFDIAGLVEKQLPGVAAADTSRTAFLTDFMNTGGTGFQSQVDQAIRSSLTGPQVTGAGDSARARMGAYAAEQVGRNNAGQRLQAAGQLAGPTGLGTLTQQTAPLYGTTSAGTTSGTNVSTGTNTGVSSQASNNTNTTNQVNDLVRQAQTLDFQSLVGQESQQGTATGTSASAGAGITPEGQPVKTGGCVVCTAYVELGLMNEADVRKAVVWKLSERAKYSTAVDGYMLYGPTLARLVLGNKVFAWGFRPIARAILDHEVYLSAPTGRWRLIPRITHALFDVLSRPVGLFSRLFGLDTGVRCPKVRALLERQNLSFKL